MPINLNRDTSPTLLETEDWEEFNDGILCDGNNVVLVLGVRLS